MEGYENPLERNREGQAEDGEQEELFFEAFQEDLTAEMANRAEVTFETIDGTSAVCMLEIRLVPDSVEDRKSVCAQVEESAEQHGLELSLRGTGPGSAFYKVFPKIYEGRTNWRRWITDLSAFTPEQAKILDEIADFEEIREVVESGHEDSYGKLSKFIRMARGRGLITETEHKDISDRMPRAVG